MENNLISRLRNATGQVHKDLEALPVSKAVVSPELTTASYIDYLHRMLIIHRAMEAQVFPIVSEFISDLDSRKKEAMILNDLHTLNASNQVLDIFLDADFKKHVPFCIGMLYVSEGSTLGGQYIVKNVQKVLGEKSVNATTFLNAHGSRTGSMWKAFTEKLNQYEKTLTEAEILEVEAGAVYGFARTAAVFGQIK